MNRPSLHPSVLLLALTLLLASLAAPGAGAATAKRWGDRGSGKVVRDLGFGLLDAEDVSVRRVVLHRDGELYVMTALAGGGAYVWRFTPDGELDRSFADGGVLRTNLSTDLAIQRDRSVVVTGTVGGGGKGTDVGLARYLPGGRLDKRFGDGGRLRAGSRQDDRPVSLFIRPGGTINVGTGWTCAVEGCDAAGAALISFDQGGRLKFNRPVPGSGLGSLALAEDGTMLGVSPHRAAAGQGEGGRILRIDPAGTASTVWSTTDPAKVPSDIALDVRGDIFYSLPGEPAVRALTPGGEPLESFAEGGAAYCPGGGSGEPAGIDLEVDSQGRPTAAGGTGPCGAFRLTPEGLPDYAFGLLGRLDTRALGSGDPRRLDLAPDGRVVIAGVEPGTGALRLLMLGPEGLPDPEFGQEGLVSVPVEGSSADQLTTLLPGRGGSFLAIGTSAGAVSVSAFNRRGRTAPAFGEGGTARSFAGSGDRVLGASLDGEGRIQLAGAAAGPGAGDSFLVARLRADGSPDPSFGEGGRSTLEGEGFEMGATGTSAAVWADGVLAGGYAASCPRYACTQGLLVRYDGEGRLDPDFGEDGVVRIGDPEGSTVVRAVAVLPDGRILAAGRIGSRLAVMRFLPDGAPDPGFASEGVAEPRLPGRIGGKRVLSWKAGTIAPGRGGRVLVGGSAAHRSESGAVVQLDSRGRAVRSFGRRGIALVPNLGVTDLGADRCGRVGLVGTTPSDRLGVARLSRSGQVDRRFAKKGVLTPFAAISSGSSIVVDRRGNLTAGGTGSVRPATNGDLLLARYSGGPCKAR